MGFRLQLQYSIFVCYTRPATHFRIHILYEVLRMTFAQLVLNFFPSLVSRLESLPLNVPTSGERSTLSPKSLHTPGQLQRTARSLSGDKTRPLTGDSEKLPGSHSTQTAVFLRLFKIATPHVCFPIRCAESRECLCLRFCKSFFFFFLFLCHCAALRYFSSKQRKLY